MINNNPDWRKSVIPFLVMMLALVFIMPRAAKFPYEYKKGSNWKYETLTAKFDFPILKTEEQLREDEDRAAAYVIPYYRFSDDIMDKNLAAAASLNLGPYSALRGTIQSTLKNCYSRGIIADEVAVKLNKDVAGKGIEVVFLQKDKRASKVPTNDFYTYTEVKEQLSSETLKYNPKWPVDSILQAYFVYDLIVPNLVYDSQTTALVHAESRPEVSRTQGYVNAGQLIVSEGELITDAVAQMLDSYKAEYEAATGGDDPAIFYWMGNILLALAMVAMLFFAVYFANPSILEDAGRLWYLVIVFVIFAATAIFLNAIEPRWLYMVPFTLPALWLKPYFRNKVTVPVYIIVLLPLLIFTNSGIEMFVMFLTAGLVAIFAIQYFNKSMQQQFVVAAITFVALLVVYFGFRLLDMAPGKTSQTILFLAIGSIATVFLYTLVALFERLFNLVSDARLRELSDTSNKLFNELEDNAPGTYQHSLNVMSMAEVVARAVGANQLLVRAGALYHDIGKLSNPLCFIENENALPVEERTYHANLTPKQSAADIIRHVSDGLAIADKYHLPQVIKDFIITHHGTSRTAYFYNVFVNNGGDPADCEAFTYNGRKPETKEQVIVMLCDSIEAASRSFKGTTAEEYSKFVEGMVDAKIREGQLELANISIRELGIVKETIKAYLPQVRHERVAYPKMKRRVSN